MTTKHTPGPWMFDSDPVKGDPTGRIRYRVVATGKTITQTYYSSFEGGLTNAEADTRLIAAAPELLCALKGMLGAWNMICDAQGWERDDIQQQKDAVTAIAKATGAQS